LQVGSGRSGERLTQPQNGVSKASRRVWSKRIDKITSSGAQTVFNTIVPPGLTPFLEQLYNSGFTKRGGYLVCTYFDENFLAVRVQACTEV
jgi:hypothetical protein